MINQKIKNCIKQNILLIKKDLVIQTFGNVSIRIDTNHFCIKPSGIPAEELKINDIPIIRISDGKKIKGNLQPSTDTPTHQIIYKKYKDIKSIAHTHSKYATSWAQTNKSIPLLGTTHADYWINEIPVIKYINKSNLEKNYELMTGKLIIKTIENKKYNPISCPGVIVSGHGPFTWGTDETKAVLYSEMLEYIAELAFISMQIKINKKIPNYISRKHFERKHGKSSYYGQKIKKS